jgi:hypothetical protein
VEVAAAIAQKSGRCPTGPHVKLERNENGSLRGYHKKHMKMILETTAPLSDNNR